MVDFSKIDKAFAEAVELMKEGAKDNPVLQKKIAIMENVHQMGKSVVELAKLPVKRGYSVRLTETQRIRFKER